MIPPQDLNAEEGVLGAILLEGRKTFDECSDYVSPDSFYKEQNKIIFKAFQELARANEPIDLITVVSQLRKTDTLKAVGNPVYVSQLTNKIAIGTHAVNYAKRLKEVAIKRDLINFANILANSCYNEASDAFDVYEDAKKQLDKVIGHLPSNDSEKAYDVAVREGAIIREQVTNGVKGGLPYNLSDLTKYTGGGQGGDLIILAARPAMGKSSEAMGILLNAAKMGIPGAMFNLEMSKSQLILRLISEMSGISVIRIKSRELSEQDLYQIDKATEQMANLPLYINDKIMKSVSQIAKEARRLVKEKNIQWLVVDYLQLIADNSSKSSRNDEVGDISRGLKLLAKELNIPIVALSQMSRAVESRPNKRPQLSDLRDSGAIEQDADVVVFLYRPEEYQIPTIEIDGHDVDSSGLAVFIIAKNRNGKCTDVIARFNGKTTSFYDYKNESTIKPNHYF